jgi:MoxR-like ATPase
MPTDIIGTEILEEDHYGFSNSTKIIFANIVLADEINRTPPKTQSASSKDAGLEVTYGGKTYPLVDRPFFILPHKPIGRRVLILCLKHNSTGFCLCA